MQVDVSMDATASTDDALPFWLVSQRTGRFDRNATNGVTRLSGALRRLPDRWWSLSAGVDVVGRASRHSSLYLHQLYGRLHTGPVETTLGRIEHTQGIVDTTLSMGSTTWSRNVTPLPALRVATPQYVSVPWTQHFVALRGTFAHGWLERDRFVDRPYLHEKQLYIRLLPKRWPVQLHGGVVHNVVWAGTHPQLGNLADGWDTFQKVIFVSELDGDEELTGEGEDSGLGNTTAMYDVALAAQAHGWHARLYREFYIDTAAGRRLRNVWDGLWGVNLVRAESGHWIDRILFEHLRFVRQNALWGADGRKGKRGREIYYNNFLYRSGWTYAGRILGTPLALTDGDAPNIANPDDGFPVANNIIVANHLGIAGHLHARWQYRLLLTYSQNHGMLFNPQPRLDQVTTLVEVTGRPLPQRPLRVTLGTAFDGGAVFPERLGLHLGLAWTVSSLDS